MREAGLEAFRRSIGEAVPYVADRTGELRDWEQVKLLSVQVDHLRRWHRPGLLCIGDAAHAMPRLAAHLEGCPACAEDHESLRAFLLTEEPGRAAAP